MNYKNCFRITFIILISTIVVSLSYFLVTTTHYHYKPITIKYEHISRSLLIDLKRSGIEVSPSQWETLTKILKERRK